MEAGRSNVQLMILKNGDNPNNALSINFKADEQLSLLLKEGIAYKREVVDDNTVITYDSLSASLKDFGATLTVDEDKALKGLYGQIFGEGPKVGDLDKNHDGIFTFNELNQVFAEKGYNLAMKAQEASARKQLVNLVSMQKLDDEGNVLTDPTVIGPTGKLTGPRSTISEAPPEGPRSTISEAPPQGPRSNISEAPPQGPRSNIGMRPQ